MKQCYTNIVLSLLVLVSCHLTETAQCIVNMPAPAGLKKYLTNNPQKKTCYLSADFSPDNLEPFISTLAGLPSDTDGKTAKLMLVLLYNWALSAENLIEQLERIEKISLCIKQIEDPDAREESSYWFEKCSFILPRETNDIMRSTALDLFGTIDIPKKLQAYISHTHWSLQTDFSVEEIPDYINAILSISPQLYVTCAHITFRQKALLALCRWAVREERLVDSQELLSTIKKNIDQITNQSAKQELAYWFKKGLSLLLFIKKNAHRTENILNLLLDNGAYLKSSYNGKTLFSYPSLDEKLYNRLKKAGLKPNSESLCSAIRHNDHNALDTLLQHGINIHKHICGDGGNAFVKLAIKESNTYALRRLLQKGIDVNQKDKNGETLIEYLVKKGISGEDQNKTFNLLMGQQPQELPDENIGDFDYEPKAYHDFTTIQSGKDLKEWCYNHFDYGKHRISNAFIDYGTTQQFKNGIARIIKNYKRFEKLNHITLTQRTPGLIYAELSVQALECGAETGFFRLLSLGVQQQSIQEWMFEKGRTKVPEDQFLPNKTAQADKAVKTATFEKFKNSEWLIGDYEMRYVNLAFAPLVIQKNLKKILGTDQKKPKLSDITVIVKN